MPIFDSGGDAYGFAISILNIRRGAKGVKYVRGTDGELQLCGEGGPGKPGKYEERVLDAIRILQLIERHDIRNGRGSWFADWFLPDPINPPPAFEKGAISKILRQISAFECDLAAQGFMVHCGRKYCRRKNLH